MERSAFNRIAQAGQLTWEELHPTEFVHPNLQDALSELLKAQAKNESNLIKEENNANGRNK